jgi:hypothetical protein
MKTLLPLTCLALTLTSLSARDLTNAAGRTIQAELVV